MVIQWFFRKRSAIPKFDHCPQHENCRECADTLSRLCKEKQDLDKMYEIHISKIATLSKEVLRLESKLGAGSRQNYMLYMTGKSDSTLSWAPVDQHTDLL